MFDPKLRLVQSAIFPLGNQGQHFRLFILHCYSFGQKTGVKRKWAWYWWSGCFTIEKLQLVICILGKNIEQSVTVITSIENHL